MAVRISIALVVAAAAGLVALPAVLRGTEQTSIEVIQVDRERAQPERRQEPHKPDAKRDRDRGDPGVGHGTGPAASPEDAPNPAPAAIPVAPTTPAPADDGGIARDTEGGSRGDGAPTATENTPPPAATPAPAPPPPPTPIPIDDDSGDEGDDGGDEGEESEDD